MLTRRTSTNAIRLFWQRCLILQKNFTLKGFFAEGFRAVDFSNNAESRSFPKARSSISTGELKNRN